MTHDELVEHGKRLAIGLAFIGVAAAIGLGIGYLLRDYPAVILPPILLSFAYLAGLMWRTRP